MENLYITHYHDSRCSPFFSITRLHIHEAYALAKELSSYASQSFTSFSRFTEKDFDGYYKKRIRTEEWLYTSFIELGGKPETTHPLYFVLGKSDYLQSWYEKGLTLRLPFDLIDSEDISFTYGDSMSMMDSDKRLNPFTKNTLLDFISHTHCDMMSYLNHINKQNKYIEVQLWNDKYVKEWID